jgi:hypothetical protein
VQTMDVASNRVIQKRESELSVYFIVSFNLISQENSNGIPVLCSVQTWIGPVLHRYQVDSIIPAHIPNFGNWRYLHLLDLKRAI